MDSRSITPSAPMEQFGLSGLWIPLEAVTKEVWKHSSSVVGRGWMTGTRHSHGMQCFRSARTITGPDASLTRLHRLHCAWRFRVMPPHAGSSPYQRVVPPSTHKSVDSDRTIFGTSTRGLLECLAQGLSTVPPERTPKRSQSRRRHNHTPKATPFGTGTRPQPIGREYETRPSQDGNHRESVLQTRINHPHRLIQISPSRSYRRRIASSGPTANLAPITSDPRP